MHRLHQMTMASLAGVPAELPIPAAPTAGIVDDEEDTFDWTNTEGYTDPGDYEYSLNAGSSVEGEVTAKPLVVGDVALDAGDVGVRVKAVESVNQASAWLFSEDPFTVATGGGGIDVGNATEDAYFAWYEDSRTFSHNNNGDYLIVAVATGYTGANTEPSGVTYNGVSMNRIEGVALSGFGSLTGSLWGLANPASGANNVVVSFANEQISLYCVAVSFDGVHQTVSTGTAPTPTLGTDNAPTINVPSAEGDLIVGLAFTYWLDATVWTDGTGNTRIHEGVSVRSNNDVAGIVSVKDGAATSTAISWTDTEGFEWGVVAVALKPA